MYDIRQFRPALYALVVLGITGFAVAAGTWGTWLLAAAAIGAHAVLARDRGDGDGRRLPPLPRWAANLVTVAGFLLMATQLRGDLPIVAIGQFLVLLQVVKLYERRPGRAGNRDDAWVIVLSLLLMVAAAITTGSLLFGAVLAAYLLLALYGCLLFHLKCEADAAKVAMDLAARGPGHPLTLRQDQRFLPRSMRRLTLVVSVVAVATAVAVFVAFPREAGAGFLGQPPLPPGQALVGLSDEVSFQDVARIQQSDERAGYLKLSDSREQPITDGRPLYLRANVLDTYISDPEAGNRWQWLRTTRQGQPRLFGAGVFQRLPLAGDKESLRQEITLDATGTRSLPAIRGVAAFRPERRVALTYAASDAVLKADDPLRRRVSYTVVSNDELPDVPTRRGFDAPPREFNERVREYVLRPEVSGLIERDDGTTTSRAAQRLSITEGVNPRRPLPIDAQIASNVELHLKTRFGYTLDLTDAADLIGGGDPLEVFLYDLKRGHCEYFAGAMAVMLQSIGIDARVVVGFYCDEFNPQTGAYVLRQNQAHAWVEVRTTDGWQRYDPTSSRQAEEPQQAGQLSGLWNLLDFFRYTWEEQVVSYDGEARESLWQSAELQLQGTASRGSDLAGDLTGRLSGLLGAGRFGAAERAITWTISIAVVLGLLAVGWFVAERWRLRRRARRIGLDALPPGRRRRLARQLRFYDDMTRELARRGFSRRPSQTPAEFAASLSDLPAPAFETVGGLTRIYYRVRYGEHRLTRTRQRRLQNSLDRMAVALG